ncbi:peptidase inhibitor family I36 protein [Pleurocapsa sp. PCC 7319]|uniref:peptidase inhibitor family I36 protein n=1 Tax=Pleurocapsa sp. PCC 7319 TaxID=118161 RepID=UPI00034B180A|nr:peptidase inhibitor family I36 protein [Pleurocapsa sp. PCC 7319]
MSKINNQPQSLSSIEFIQDITPETAETYSGGALPAGVYLFTEPNLTGQVRMGDGVADLAVSDQQEGMSIDDQTSVIYNGTEQPWAFYAEANYTGQSLMVQPGQAVNLHGTIYDNTITSYRSEPLAP